MDRSMKGPPFWACLFACLGVAHAAGGVLVVPTPGLPTVQAAVDAADGDVIVVRAANPPFQVIGKSLTIQGDLAAPVPIDPGPILFPKTNVNATGGAQTRIAGVQAGQRVILRNLDLGGLEIQGCAGLVQIEDCAVSLLSSALRIEDSTVTLTRATLRGPDGSVDFLSSVPTYSGAGLVSDDSHLVLDHCQVSGGAGQGFFQDVHGFYYGGDDGGHGAQVTGGTLFMLGSTLSGGDGGTGGHFFGQLCAPGGKGASGLLLENGAIAYEVATAFAGGTGAIGLAPIDPGDPSSACMQQTSADGAPLSVSPGAALKHIAGAARGLAASSPAVAGSGIDLAVSGEPGDAVLLLIGQAHTQAFAPALGGVLHLAAPFHTAPYIVLGASGDHATTIPLPPMPTGLEGVEFTVQAAFAPASGPPRLGSVSHLLILTAGI